LDTFPPHVPHIVVLDRDLNYSGEVSLDPLADIIDFAIDIERDRLLILTSAGRLLVLRGHAGAIVDQPPRPVPPRHAVQWIVPSPDFEHDRTVMATFSNDEYRSYGSNSGTLFVNRDNGQTWQMVTGLPISRTAAALAFSPDFVHDRTLFVGLVNGGPLVTGSGLYRSTDGGQTWQPASRGLTDLMITRLVVSPDFAVDHTLFAAGTSGGLFRSTDGGTSWTPLADRYRTDQSAWATLTALAISPNFARDQRLLIGADGTWLSRDGGGTWAMVLPEAAVSLAYLADAQTVYAILSSANVARSDDGGEHWVMVGDGLEVPPDGTLGMLAGDDFALAWVNLDDQPTRLFYRPIKDLPWRKVGSADQPLGNVFALAGDDSLFTGDITGTLHRYSVDDVAAKITPLP
jgi:hypothetical protein